MDMYYAHCTCIDIHTGERERLFTARWTTKDFAWTCTMHIVHASTSIQERERDYLQHAGLSRTLHGTCTMHMFHAMSSIQEREREIIYSTLDYQGLCMDMYYAHCTCIDIHTGERERVFTARWTNKDIAWNMYYAHVPCNVIHTGEREREYLQHAGLPRTLHGHVLCTLYMHRHPYRRERESIYSTLD